MKNVPTLKSAYKMQRYIIISLIITIVELFNELNKKNINMNINNILHIFRKVATLKQIGDKINTLLETQNEKFHPIILLVNNANEDQSSMACHMQ
jgi:hypothetical protein